MKESYTTRELAERAGVPWQTIVAWKRNEKIPKNAVTEGGRFLKSVIDPILESGGFDESKQQAPSSKSTTPAPRKTDDELTFEAFARDYWQEGTKAVDVLLMPAEVSSLLVKHVNEALNYAWETLR